VPLIAVNNIELYYESHGADASLAMLGGLGLDVSEMGMLTGPLAARFRVIAVGNRSPGVAPPQATPSSGCTPCCWHQASHDGARLGRRHLAARAETDTQAVTR